MRRTAKTWRQDTKKHVTLWNCDFIESTGASGSAYGILDGKRADCLYAKGWRSVSHSYGWLFLESRGQSGIQLAPAAHELWFRVLLHAGGSGVHFAAL